MKNKLLKTRTLGLAMAAVLATGSFFDTSATAATATANLQVTATIAGSCSITTSPVAFGTIPTNGSMVSANGSVNVTCSSGTTAVVTLDEGLNRIPGSSSLASPYRQMKHNSADSTLSYSLAVDSAGIMPFGNHVGGLNTITSTGAEQSVIVYGFAASSSSTLVPGSYADTVVATVTY